MTQCVDRTYPRFENLMFCDDRDERNTSTYAHHENEKHAERLYTDSSRPRIHSHLHSSVAA